jgi:hypothetical protein
MTGFSQLIWILALSPLVPLARACQCQTSYTACNEVAVSDLVFIGTVESMSPVFLSRWNLRNSATLQSLNAAYLAALDHPSDASLARLKDAYMRSFPDLAPDEKDRLRAAKTASAVTSLFYSTLSEGQQVRFKVKTVFKHEEDDDKNDKDDKDGKADNDDKDGRKPHEEYFEVSTPFGDCGVEFQAGETYLVYANNDENSGLYSTATCTRSRRLSDAGEDLPYLFFYKEQREQSSRLEGFTTTDGAYQLDLDKLHDPEAIRSPAPGIVVELRSGRLTRYAATDGKGRFIFDGLGEGDYALSAFAPGYPLKPDALAGPRLIHVAPRSCALQILVLPKPEK